MRSGIRRVTRNGGLLIAAQALAYFAGYLIGSGLHAINQYVHPPTPPLPPVRRLTR